MSVRFGRIVVASLLLAACSTGGGHASSTSTTSRLSAAGVAALIKTLRCSGGVPTPAGAHAASVKPGTGLTPVAVYDCARPKGVGANLSRYTAKQMREYRSPAAELAICRGVNIQMKVKTLYVVLGGDYTLTAAYSGPGADPRKWKERSEALARAVGLDLTTIPCD